ncbi:DUF4400 domain-containing protein [Thiopseudomonas alkaliphila]|uniref:DUF4400 domain-containing protein n=1 Tax=Thiopseudomonas alkaliphila TaxID=1697053 RepID=UPI002574C586|nr:DUF4400 domain-containing protein [Thiopseudomonas alkaliphila]MDM1717347.1 DUF4400 domain-containing protein [Thiopseudomonas alkaliphila]
MKQKFWWMAVIVFFGQLLAVAIFTPFGWASKAMEQEKVYIERHLGHDGSRAIFREATRWHKKVLIDSGVYAAAVDTLIPTARQKERSKGIENMGTTEGWFRWVKRRIDTVSKVIHHTFMRISLLKLWSPYILIFLVPAAYDGLMTWKVKRTNFSYVSPVLHRYGIRGIGLLFIVFLLMFFAPIAVDPIFIPFALIIACLLFGMALGNMQKRI